MAKEIKKYLFAASLVVAFFVFSPAVAEAATLYFSPSSGSYTAGDILSTNILVNTQGQEINNADAVINFPASNLEVVSVSKSGSIFSLWVEEPAFSNSAGTISFNGGLPTPGYNGGSGKILGIVFRIKQAGSASVVCSSAAVRANDGFGTNVLQSCAQAQFTLLSKASPTPSEPTPVVTPEPAAGTTPRPPQVSSNTHPDSNSWYSNKNPDFKWTNPSGITGVNVLGDRNPDTDPGTRSDGNFDTYDFTDVDDGVWYFHIKLRNAAGWGPTGHFKFQIDTVAPSSFEIKSFGSEAQDGKAKFEFIATDATSGIDYYEITINGGPAVTWKDDGSHVYQTETLETGNYNMVVKAVDAAGNFVESKADFAVVNNLPVSRAQGQGITFRISLAPVKAILKYLGLGVLGLLALWILAYILRKTYKFLSGIKIKLPASGSRNLKKAFNNLNQTVRENIELLESAKSRRKLTHEEEEILSSLKKASFAKINEEAVVLSSEGHHKIIEGTFDGQNMAGFDSKAYAIPPNYASKSKLVEGDMLKLTIAEDGTFVYKQIAPVEREKKRGTLVFHDHGDFRVVVDNHAYKVLVSALTYFQAEPGDHVTIVVPKGKEAVWAAVESVHKAPPKPFEFIEPKSKPKAKRKSPTSRGPRKTKKE